MAQIEDYSFGRVTVDGKEHTHDVVERLAHEHPSELPALCPELVKLQL
jgi:hypothetical protein